MGHQPILFQQDVHILDPVFTKFEIGRSIQEIIGAFCDSLSNSGIAQRVCTIHIISWKFGPDETAVPPPGARTAEQILMLAGSEMVSQAYCRFGANSLTLSMQSGSL